MTAQLPPARRSELRSEAHRLAPVVMIGDKGLTDEVVAEIDRSLKAHELVKVRAASGEREQRESWMVEICARLEAHAVQRIGKVLVIYRENPKPEPEPKRKLGPGPSPHSGARGDEINSGARGDEIKGTERRRSRTPSRLPASAPRRRRPRTSQ